MDAGQEIWHLADSSFNHEGAAALQVKDNVGKRSDSPEEPVR